MRALKINVFISIVYLLVSCGPKVSASNSQPTSISQTHSHNTLSPVASISTSSTAEAGGQGSTGGGDGIACFENEADVTLYVAKDGTIPMENRDKIKKLYFLDYESQWQNPLDPLPGEGPQEMVSRIIESKVRPLNRVFANRLGKALHLLDINHWNAKKPLPILNDSNRAPGEGWDNTWISKLKNKPACVPIQIVLRHAISKGQKSPRIKVDFDDDYFTRLLTMNPHNIGIAMQAALYMHEALYIIAVELGQFNSESVRFLTGDLFFKGTWEIETPRRFLLDIYKSGFYYFSSVFSGDYPRSLEKELNLESLRTLNKKKITAIESLIDDDCRPDQLFQTIYLMSNAMPLQSSSPSKCDWIQKAMMDTIIPQLTPRESFIATAEEAFNNNKIESFDALFASDELKQSENEGVCNYAQKNSSNKDDENLQRIFQMTKDYCSNLLLQ